MKKKIVFAMLCIFSFAAYGQTKDSIAHTFLVADYDYTCHTSNAQGEDTDVNYGLTLQVAKDMACTMVSMMHAWFMRTTTDCARPTAKAAANTRTAP